MGRKKSINFEIEERQVRKMKDSEYIENFLTYLRKVLQFSDIAAPVQNDMDKQTQDILHSIENDRHTSYEYICLGLIIRRIRRERRKAKDRLKVSEPILTWVEGNQKCIKSLERLLGDVRKAEKSLERRVYVPRTDVVRRVLEDHSD